MPWLITATGPHGTRLCCMFGSSSATPATWPSEAVLSQNKEAAAQHFGVFEMREYTLKPEAFKVGARRMDEGGRGWGAAGGRRGEGRDLVGCRSLVVGRRGPGSVPDCITV